MKNISLLFVVLFASFCFMQSDVENALKESVPAVPVIPVVPQLPDLFIDAIETGAVVYTSTNYDINHQFGFRLNTISPGFASSWVADVQDLNQYIQIGVGEPHRWYSVKTQGRYGSDQHVINYIVQHTMNGRDWVEADNGRIFDGNTDSNTVVENRFNQPFMARAIRICPTAWRSYIAMRVEAVYIQDVTI
jgi:hypothetical protein